MIQIIIFVIQWEHFILFKKNDYYYFHEYKVPIDEIKYEYTDITSIRVIDNDSLFFYIKDLIEDFKQSSIATKVFGSYRNNFLSYDIKKENNSNIIIYLSSLYENIPR